MFEDYLETVRHPALRLIAKEASRRGLSVRRLAQLAGRDDASVRRTFDVDTNPQRRTIDALARAVGIDPIRLHAELGDMNDAECKEVFSQVINRVRVSDAFAVAPIEAATRFTHAFCSAVPQAQNAAVRAFVLAEVKAPALTADLLAEAMAEIAGAESQEASAYSYQDLFRTTALKRFAEALGEHGTSLLSLFREWEPCDAALWMIANDFSLYLGFSHDEVRRCMAPAIALLRKRNDARLPDMLAYARHQNMPFIFEGE